MLFIYQKCFNIFPLCAQMCQVILLMLCLLQCCFLTSWIYHYLIVHPTVCFCGEQISCQLICTHDFLMSLFSSCRILFLLQSCFSINDWSLTSVFSCVWALFFKYLSIQLIAGYIGESWINSQITCSLISQLSDLEVGFRYFWETGHRFCQFRAINSHSIIKISN